MSILGRVNLSDELTVTFHYRAVLSLFRFVGSALYLLLRLFGQ